MSCVTLGKYLTSLSFSFLICNMKLPSKGCCENRGSKYVKSTQNSRAWGGLSECVLRVGAPALPVPPAWCPTSLPHSLYSTITLAFQLLEHTKLIPASGPTICYSLCPESFSLHLSHNLSPGLCSEGTSFKRSSLTTPANTSSPH